MKLAIVGDGSFGSFLRTLLVDHFEIVNQNDPFVESIILAVPISAYEECAKQLMDL